MRLHQVLTGAANVIEDSVAISHGNVNGYPFTVYGSGYEVVILDCHFNRVQIMSSHKVLIFSIVKGISCAKADGKIAVSFGKKVVLYQAEKVQATTEMKLPYLWKIVTIIPFDSEVEKLCWDVEGERLLIGSDNLHMWKLNTDLSDDDDVNKWTCVWHRRFATPPKHLLFSPDGHYFASAGQGDRMVKIWFRAPKVCQTATTRPFHRSYSGHSCASEDNYNFVYIFHPSEVVSFSWRNTSKHMPTCSVPNVLLTSCADNICRIWSETVKYKPSNHTTPHQPSEYSSPTKSSSSTKKKKDSIEKLLQSDIQSDMDNTYFSKDHQNYHLISLFHFHLAAVINPTSDIALLSTIPTTSIFGRCFQLHWLNNKEIQFTTAIEAMHENFKKSAEANYTDETDDPFSIIGGVDTEIGDPELYDKVKTLDRNLEDDYSEDEEDDAMLEMQVLNAPQKTDFIPSNIDIPGFDASSYKGQLDNLLHKWMTSTDTLFCIHPFDGSLLIWIVDYLDNFKVACYRQVQVSFASRIPSTFTKADASSLCWMRSYHYTQPVQKELSSGGFLFTFNPGYKATGRLSKGSANEQLSLLQVSYLISAHADGSLNLWLVTFSDTGSFTGITSITHVTRSCGPRFETTKLISHPVLPLVLGTSKRTNDICYHRHEIETTNIADIESELILWHTKHVSPLSTFKGVTEMARISSPNPLAFSSIAWVPALYQHSLLSITNNEIELLPDGPCTCFVVASNSGIELYQVLLDAKNLLSNLAYQNSLPDVPMMAKNLSSFIISEQSGSHSACIMKLCTLESSQDLQRTKFLHVYSKHSMLPKSGSSGSKSDVKLDSFFITSVSTTLDNRDIINVWCIDIETLGKYNTKTSVTPQSPDSILSNDSFSSMPVISSSHCLKQSHIYSDFLHESYKKICAASDLHCSNSLNPSCPLNFNFVTYSDESIKFWNFVLSENEIDKSVCTLEEVNETLKEQGVIVCLNCASTELFAFVVELFDSNLNKKYNIYIYENQSTGGLYWVKKQTIPIINVLVLEENMIELSWLHLENGSYLLALAFNNSIFIYNKDRKEFENGLQSSIWVILKDFSLFDDKSPLRLTTISWSRGGFFMVGVENEIQVYSQWEDTEEVTLNNKTISLFDGGRVNEHGFIITKNSFTEACKSMCTLPQYHPYHLIELLNLGKLRRVRLILRHLLHCVSGNQLTSESNLEADDFQKDPEVKLQSRTRTFSEISTFSSNGDNSILKTNSNVTISVIPPLMLSTLTSVDRNKNIETIDGQNAAVQGVYSVLFNQKVDDDDEDKLDSPKCSSHYGVSQAKQLNEYLEKSQLPGITSQEQMYLLLLSETVASTDYDVEVGVSAKNQKTNDNDLDVLHGVGGGGYAASVAASGSSLDDCGLRYMLAARHYTALLKCGRHKSNLLLGMRTSDICWAFHSDCKEDLLTVIPSMLKNSTTWKDLRDHGAGWWIRSNDMLKRTLEKVAKVQFQINQDPMDCALFYLAMKKKSLLCTLYRSLRDNKMSLFFANDFTQDRWRKAALKNAFVLLGKQRFEHAAAFFLLGNALWDAIQVCLTRLKDIQLALVISRLYENNNDVHNDILQRYVIQSELDPPVSDPFIISMSHWILNDYRKSLEVLLLSTVNEQELVNYPAIFNFYFFLQSHPMLTKLYKTKMNFSESLHNINLEELKVCERKLFFKTALFHLESSLPDIAIEVLSMQDLVSTINVNENDNTDFSYKTGSEIISTSQVNNSIDWSKPVVNQEMDTTDWSKPVNVIDDEEYKGLSLDDSSFDTVSDKSEDNSKTLAVVSNDNNKSINQKQKLNNKTDILALNLKFICVMQCLIESLKALSSKCMLENVKLRSALSELLNHELAFLHLNCDYNFDGLEIEYSTEQDNRFLARKRASTLYDFGSLIKLNNDSSLGEKVEAITLHSEWLRSNHSVLSSLYEYCLMVGTGHAELTAVCLELLLLLHEVEDHRVLSAPLSSSISAGPNAPPLLLASMTSFSLVISPTMFLKSMAHDLLHTVINLPGLPNPQNPVTRLSDMESLLFSLSSCVYHSLCGGDEDKLLASLKKGETELVGMQSSDGKLIRMSPGSLFVDLEPTSAPSQWPGVKFLVTLLTSSSRDRSQQIRLLLCEISVAIYLSMLVSASSRLSCQNLYRLVTNSLSEKMWNAVFGGGTKVVVHAPDETDKPFYAQSPNFDLKRDTTRMRWNYKLLGNKSLSTANIGEEERGLVRHELFILPKSTLCDYFLRKPQRTSFNYDSEEDEFSDDEDKTKDHEEDDPLKSESEIKIKRDLKELENKKLNEHCDSMSYAWLIMQLGIVKLTSLSINSFISMLGIEILDLPTQSLLLYNATKILIRWEQLLTVKINASSALTENVISYHPPISGDGFQRGGVALNRLKVLLDPQNTPFSNKTTKSQPAKRLWHSLVSHEPLRAMFLHYAFSSVSEGDDEIDYDSYSCRVLHKDPEPVTNLCLNKSNLDYMAISTTQEIIEYDISGAFKVDLFSFDVEGNSNSNENSAFAEDRPMKKPFTPNVIQRRTCSGIRRMASHPTLPYYVTGGADGSVRMWEFVHPDQIHLFRGPGQNERVNKVQFYGLGNKFAVVDDSGYLSMWMITNTQNSTPFLTLRCHTKCCYDFAYLGSSSLIATVGFTNDKKNICIWDTLLPEKNALIHRFAHNIHGAQSLAYVSSQQTIISGGKRGDVSIFDIKQRQLLHTFQAHDCLIKTIAIDPVEQFFVTGTIDGDLKVWDLATLKMVESFSREHSRGTVSLRHVSPGVQCIKILEGNQMFSCGGDGSVKWRVLKLNDIFTGVK